MKLAYVLIPVCAALILSACSSGEYRWFKSGYSKEQTRNKYAECVYDIRTKRTTVLSASESQESLKACMEKDGFRWRYVED